MSLSSASPPWMTFLSCSPSQPASTLLQWLSFVFLSPCPQRMLFSIVDGLFLLVLFGLAIQKLIVRFWQRSGTPEEEKPLLIKAQQRQQQPILTTIRFKIDRRSRSHTRLFSYSSSSSQSSKAPLVLGFISCLAWLYVADRLWQDAGNRMLLSSLLRENSGNRPRVLTVEDKLMNLGCKEIGRRIVEAEMELTFAKSLGFLRQKSVIF